MRQAWVLIWLVLVIEMAQQNSRTSPMHTGCSRGSHRGRGGGGSKEVRLVGRWGW